jgi:surfeit locus 1 family protein
VSLRIANHRFAPTLLATVLTIVAIAGFVRLGVWQLSRAAEKESLQSQYRAGQQSTIELTAGNAHSLARYQRIRARGRYDSARQILLDNMPSAMGQPGYRVVTAFALEQDGWILVDRGWRPWGATRSDLPDVTVGEDVRTIAGQLGTLPRPGVRLRATAASSSWPRVLNFPEHAALEQALERKVLPGLVLLDADQPDGFERVWQARIDLGSDQHLGYAVQWFAFAAVAAVLYVIMGLRRGRSLDAAAG